MVHTTIIVLGEGVLQNSLSIEKQLQIILYNQDIWLQHINHFKTWFPRKLFANLNLKKQTARRKANTKQPQVRGAELPKYTWRHNAIEVTQERAWRRWCRQQSATMLRLSQLSEAPFSFNKLILRFCTTKFYLIKLFALFVFASYDF